MTLNLIQQFATALALSILIGLEREQHKTVLKNTSFAGVRTFSLIGLAGALAFSLMEISVWAFVLICAVVFSFIVSSYVITSSKFGRIGVTTEMAAVLTFIIGGLCSMGQYIFAVSLSLVVLAIMYFKIPLHSWAKSIKRTEIIATIKFLLIAFVILPLLPDRQIVIYGYELFNPYFVWLMVVLVSGISFLSYVAIKIFGVKKGIGFSGFLAGLISSTALTLGFSKDSKDNKAVVAPYVFAVVIAGTAMFFRVLVEIFVLNRILLFEILLPFLVMAIVGGFSAFFVFAKGDKNSADQEMKKEVYELKSPFSLWPALKFGAFFAFILIVSKIGQSQFGDSGLYIVSFISGLLDVDAIAVSVAGLAKNGLSNEVAANALAIAVISNTMFKGFLFFLFGARRPALKILAIFSTMAAVGFFVAFLI